jgi:hypothetical protein
MALGLDGNRTPGIDFNLAVMPGLDPGIHRAAAPWIAGSSPAMTYEILPRYS